MNTLKGNSAIYEGLSTDSKPTNVDINTRFHELDTNKWYYFKSDLTWGETPDTGGGGGFTPTTEQLAAMNSGIDSTKVQQISTNETNISTLQEQVGYAITELQEVL